MDVTIAPESALQRAPLAGGRDFLRQQKPSRTALARWVDGALLAWWVDGGLAGLASRRGLLGRRAACCRFPRHLHTLERTPRAVENALARARRKLRAAR